MHAIMCGDPWSGFQFYGPFDTGDEAVGYAEDHLSHKEFWWVVKLQREV